VKSHLITTITYCHTRDNLINLYAILIFNEDLCGEHIKCSSLLYSYGKMNNKWLLSYKIVINCLLRAVHTYICVFQTQLASSSLN
jgi:hypothetical protein